MSDLIDECETVSKGVVEITEMIKDVDGDITELQDNEQQAIAITMKTLTLLASSIDKEKLSTDTESNDDSTDTGPAYY